MKTFLLLLAVISCNLCLAQASSQGPFSGGTFANNSSVGTVAWSNLSNASASDNVFTSTGISLGILSSANTNYIVATNFGFTVPAGATITGITVEVEKKYDLLLGLLSSITDNSVRIVKGGVIGSTNKGSASGWPSTNSYKGYGGSSDMWGQTWTAADVNATDFGVAVSVSVSAGLAALTMNAMIDHIRITVSFNIPVPVKFVDFDAIKEKGKVKLAWSTASESNSDKFIIEKSMPGAGDWSVIGSVDAAHYSDELRNYVAYDYAPGNINIYRIRQTDLDGRSIYSKLVMVNYNQSDNNSIKVFPNPAREAITVYAVKPITAARLVSMDGREVLTMQSPSFGNIIKLPVRNLPQGVYSLVTTTGKEQFVQQVVID